MRKILIVIPLLYTTALKADMIVDTSEADLTIARMKASRFLKKATMGPNPTEVNNLADRILAAGELNAYGEWFNTQTGMSQRTALDHHFANVVHVNKGMNARRQEHAWWDWSIKAPDQFRVKAAHVWSQMMPASQEVTANNRLAGMRYWEVLYANALGSHKDLLSAVTFNTTMGAWLSHLLNDKGDESLGVFADENYAREVMQLFTIGIYSLNNDGTFQFDNNGERVENYDNEDITEIAKVFTGFHYDNGSSFARGATDWTKPMLISANNHDESQKNILGNNFPAGRDGYAEVSDLLDILTNHSSCAPFIGRELIKKYSSANPSNAYVASVANVYRSTNGNLTEVIKAILTHDESINAVSYIKQNIGGGQTRILVSNNSVSESSVMTVLEDKTPTSGWKQIDITGFEDPIIIASPLSHTGADPCHVRIRNVEAGSFEYMVEEWDYLDGNHAEERVFFLVMERGIHSLGGVTWEAGSATVDERWKKINLLGGFAGNQNVFSQCVTFNGPSAVVTRHQNVLANSFEIFLQEEKANNPVHANETVHYIAHGSGVAPRVGDINGIPFQSFRQSGVTDNSSTINFPQSAGSSPALFAQIRTFVGGDPSGLRTLSLNNSSASIFVEEEASDGSGTVHRFGGGEVVDWLVFDMGSATTATGASNNTVNYEGVLQDPVLLMTNHLRYNRVESNISADEGFVVYDRSTIGTDYARRIHAPNTVFFDYSTGFTPGTGPLADEANRTNLELVSPASELLPRSYIGLMNVLSGHVHRRGTGIQHDRHLQSDFVTMQAIEAQQWDFDEIYDHFNLYLCGGNLPLELKTQLAEIIEDEEDLSERMELTFRALYHSSSFAVSY